MCQLSTAGTIFPSLATLLNIVPLEVADQAGGLSEWLHWSYEFLFKLDDKLKDIVRDYGIWSHLVLFVVVFCETGLVFTPFLPGDSLLFAAGSLAADRTLRIELLIPLLIVAAIAGDTVNYWMGKWFGDHAFNGKIPFLKRAHLDKTHLFFEKYGAKSIILARFVPIIRTFAPFVAGMGSMNYRQFLIYNVIGGVAWVLLFVPLGYAFGKMPIVEKYFELVMLGIVGLSLAPPAWELLMHWLSRRKEAALAKSEPVNSAE
jgi:membrane-associated protein